MRVAQRQCSNRASLGDHAICESSEGGVSLLETTIAMLLLLMVLLSVTQLYVASAAINKAADDITQVTTLASEKIEQLRQIPYNSLAAGGSLLSDESGYSDSPDVEDDGDVDYTRRWAIVDQGDYFQLDVRVIAQIAASGTVKETTLTAIAAPR
ncbi:MAG TPA: hypothetical protein QGG47_15340 [Acidobacteriota bacterium]|nr:hypothetical protein [Acidobacteriota bacterium]